MSPGLPFIEVDEVEPGGYREVRLRQRARPGHSRDRDHLVAVRSLRWLPR